MAPFKVCRLQAGGLRKAAVLHRQGKAHMLLHGEHSQAAQELLMQAVRLLASANCLHDRQRQESTTSNQEHVSLQVKLDCCLADAWTCLGHCFCQNDNLVRAAVSQCI